MAQEIAEPRHGAATIKSGKGIPSDGQSTALISYGPMGTARGWTHLSPPIAQPPGFKQAKR